MKKITFLCGLMLCFSITLIAQSNPLTETERELLAASQEYNSQIGLNNPVSRYRTMGNNSASLADFFTQEESRSLNQYFGPRNRNALANIVPTAGATETFAVVPGDFFYDPSDGVTGGPGGDCSTTSSGNPGDYPNCGCVTTTTLTGTDLEVEFLSFNVFGNFDFLNIYDGPDTSSPQIYDSNLNSSTDTLAGMIAANGSAVFISTSGALTFEFSATAVVNTCGWEVEVLTPSGGGGGGGPCAFGNPSETITNGLGMEKDNNWILANDIDVPADTDFTPETLVFEYLNFDPEMLVSLDINFYEDAAGLPGALVVSLPAQVAVSQTIIGTAFTRNNIEATYDLSSSGVMLPGGASGTKYWIGLTGDSSNGDIAFWTSGDTINGLECSFSTDLGATWQTSTVAFGAAYDSFFDLSGECETIGTPPVCTSTQYDAVGLPFAIDGAGTTTADCAGAPNLVPVAVADAGVIGTDANIENVSIDITHTWAGDLVISLVSPTGTELILSDGNGGSADNYTGTVFEDGGADITAATAPFTGTFAPEGGTFAATFAGESITGDWQLKICDTASGDSGTVDSFTLSICVPEVVTNDECDDAIALACGDTYVGETVSDTDSGGNPAPDEFFSYTGSGSPEIVTLSLCGGGTDYDSLLRVFTDCTLGTEIATNDDACGLQSELSFLSNGTSTYFIMVEGFGSSAGNFSLVVSCTIPPVNDECTGALPITCGETILGSTNDATVDAGAPSCGQSITAPGVWYVFEDTSGLLTDYTVSLCDGGTSFDSKLTVWSGDCGVLTCVGDNDDECGLQSEVTFQGDGSTTYYILVHGFGGATGDFSLNLSCAPVPPPNDLIANSIDVDEIGFPYTDPSVAMPAATTEAGNPSGCNINGANGVWYNFTPEGDGTATASITTPGGISSVTFYTAPDESSIETDLVLVPEITNECNPGTSAAITTTAGQAYYVFVVNSGSVTDIVIDGTNLGLGDNTIEGFSFYPNPSNETLNLLSIDNIESVAIYNILGQKVIDQNIEATSTQLNVAGLSTGTYIMKVSVNGQLGTYKIIKR